MQADVFLFLQQQDSSIAVSGVDIDELMAGAASARKRCIENDFDNNDANAICSTQKYYVKKKAKSVEILL